MSSLSATVHYYPCRCGFYDHGYRSLPNWSVAKFSKITIQRSLLQCIIWPLNLLIQPENPSVRTFLGHWIQTNPLFSESLSSFLRVGKLVGQRGLVQPKASNQLGQVGKTIGLLKAKASHSSGFWIWFPYLFQPVCERVDPSVGSFMFWCLIG